MSIIESLMMSEISKKAENTHPHMVLRRKMLASIDDQIAGAKCEISGQYYTRSIERWVKHAETGNKQRMKIERPLRKWWWKSTDGLMLELRFGNRLLKVGTKSSIVIGSIDNLVAVLCKVREAIACGELDDALKTASASRKRSKKVANGAATVPTVGSTVAKTVPKIVK